MTLIQILIFSAAALALGFILRAFDRLHPVILRQAQDAGQVARPELVEGGRGWLILIGSVLALYWLQPPTPIRHLDFWLPTASLALTTIVWAVTRPASTEKTSSQDAAQLSDKRSFDFARLRKLISRPTLVTVVVILDLVVLIGLLRYLGPVCCLTPSRPPDFLSVALGLGLVIALTTVCAHLGPNKPWLAPILAVVIIGLFLILKIDSVALAASAALRALTGQPTDQASALDIRWLGFSYLAFRLLHALRDRITGKLPALSLQEFVSYAVFFPALTAGPIDRAERFAKDFRQPFSLVAPEGLLPSTGSGSSSALVEGGTRLVLGIFKKFVLADALTAIALNRANAAQTASTFWMWIVLYAYAWRIYFDFGGYSDIAIGLARWLGIKLPENFDRPYLKSNLTVFWNSWHITLAQWFRAYYFNPLTRALRSRPLAPALIIFLGQASTMILIGLWHGVTWNFVAWGAWHAVGLFIHNRWAEFARARLTQLDSFPRLKRVAGWVGIVLTFHYVALGWVWFALPSISLSLNVFRKLFGMG